MRPVTEPGQMALELARAEALLTATRFSSEYLDQPIGVVRAGAYADLTIVDDDPLARIEDAAKVVTVIKDGRPYTIDELPQPFPTPSAMAALAAPRRFVCETEPQSGGAIQRGWNRRCRTAATAAAGLRPGFSATRRECVLRQAQDDEDWGCQPTSSC